MNLPPTTTQAFLTELHNNGYKAVQTHFNNRGVKTDAPALAMQKTLKKLIGTTA
jgi:tRNA G26 N,N-dimethylase Trm1